MNIAIIPARGGSKRIPRKNIKNFNGKPIIAYPIEIALNSKLFEKVIVSTNDNEIADIARHYGAEIPFKRPCDISNDYATTAAVIQHAIAFFQEKKIPVNNICCIYPTTPFLKEQYLQDGYKLLNEETNYVFSATEYAYPVNRAFKITDNHKIEMLWPENYEKRSQDLNKVYHDAGMFYWGKQSAFENNIPIFSHNSTPLLLPHYVVHDIDTHDDWIRAELYQKLISSTNLE
jgi:pseudaminic acid cytidylyltransferase